ncbi:MAG TPA: hypothetical protein VKY85_13105 [Candidatus Angelobacter sp.]|nr:hypothetical protein [Candidatus Angelobacter sp.]
MSTGTWVRCRKVEIRGNEIHCELASDRPYDLADSYAKAPHIQFINCDTDRKLQDFVRAWGLLYLRFSSQNDERRIGHAVRSVTELRAYQRWLRAARGMIDGAKGLLSERECLLEFLLADEELEQMNPACQPDLQPISHLSLQLEFCPERNVIAWLQSCSASDVRKALAHCVSGYSTSSWPCGLRVYFCGDKLKIAPHYTLGSLWEALNWMIWFDEWKPCPPTACPVCRKIFRPLTRHKQKYCSRACAHVVAVRNWRERKRRDAKIGKQSGRQNA